ncbi:jg20209 [Pararge aegeria aegeria]|uniref:Jg20209 protein n=1 Tax=Pararge aegeria aegeria TaxID=348720 RepID=A0A8S4R701_9NEOP|nr:jg20209 [Pararge aegeria aegeria]
MARRYVVALLRLRSGHIPSKKFTHLMGISDSPNCPDCGVIDDIQHVLTECERNAVERQQIFTQSLQVEPQLILLHRAYNTVDVFLDEKVVEKAAALVSSHKRYTNVGI